MGTSAVQSLLTVHLAHGSLTFGTTLRETYVSEAPVFEVIRGRVQSSSGIYADHGGRLTGAGLLTFGATGVTSTTSSLVTIHPHG